MPDTSQARRRARLPVWGAVECMGHCGDMKRSTLQYHLGRVPGRPEPPFPFPEPLCAVNNGKVDVWDPLEVRAWWADRTGQRVHRGFRFEIVRQLKDPDGLHSAAELGRRLGVSGNTIRKWMRDLGIPTSSEAK